MVEKRVTVKNKTGLHARPAASVVSAAGKFKSALTIEKNGREVNIKSLIGLLSLGVLMGDEVIIRANGEDEEDAALAVGNLIESLSE